MGSSSTGFATQDFAAWPSFLPVMMLFFSFMGGCVGSTGGGIKTFLRRRMFQKRLVRGC